MIVHVLLSGEFEEVDKSQFPVVAKVISSIEIAGNQYVAEMGEVDLPYDIWNNMEMSSLSGEPDDIGEKWLFAQIITGKVRWDNKAIEEREKLIQSVLNQKKH